MSGASVVVLDHLLKLSVTGDTAKYLVFYTLERLCTFTTRPNKPKLSSSTQFVLRKRRELRRDLWEIVPCSSGQTQRYSSTETCRNQVPRTYLVKAEP